MLFLLESGLFWWEFGMDSVFKRRISNKTMKNKHVGREVYKVRVFSNVRAKIYDT